MTDIFVELRKNAERTPESLALASMRGHLNYGSLARRIDAVAGHAADLGIGPGQTILVDCSGADARIMLVLGLMRLGVAVGFGRGTIAYAEHGIRVDALITEDPKLVWGGRVFRLSPQWFEITSKRKPVSAGHDYTLIFSSSGSTGKQKLIKFGRRNIEYRLKSKGDDEYFTDIPRYYSTAGNTTLTTIADCFITLMKGGVVIHSSDRSPKGVLDTMSLFRPDYVSMAPGMLVRILRYVKERPRQLERVDYVRLTGAYCSVETREEGLRKLAGEIITSFGATEIGRVAWGKLADTRDVEGSVGRIIAGVQAETVDDDGEPLPAGSEGEIRIKLPKAAVASYPSAEGDKSPLRDGWFYPGDLGRIDAGGNLIVTGRKSLVINVGGNKVSPEVVEALLERMDGVADVGVLGVQDHNGFDVLCALVVKKHDLDLDSVNRFIRSSKSKFFVRKLKFVPAIPRAESGKIEREKLRDLAS